MFDSGYAAFRTVVVNANLPLTFRSQKPFTSLSLRGFFTRIEIQHRSSPIECHRDSGIVFSSCGNRWAGNLFFAAWLSFQLQQLKHHPPALGYIKTESSRVPQRERVKRLMAGYLHLTEKRVIFHSKDI
mmetsp:Transcript_14358/g.39921  ORF Transcript_14358/g.39921 Transcript_14358/m.39921 type:complete len:129 (-) Transcript_14358:144-530(-)